MEKVLENMEAVSSLIRILPTKEDKCSTCVSTAIKHFHLIVKDYSIIDPYSSLPELSDAKCSYCQKSNGNLKYCKGCENLIFYCDIKCQMKHWIEHSKTCHTKSSQDTVDFSKTTKISHNNEALTNDIKSSLDLKIITNSNGDPEKITFSKMIGSENSVFRKRRIDAVCLSQSSSFLTTLSHGSDPFDFYIQAIKYISKVEELTTELNKICKPNSCLPLSNLEPGDFCAAKYTDKKWYRAKILELGELVHVFFVDYGNDEYIMPCNLYPLPEEFYQLSALAVHCKLANIKPINDNKTWPQNAIEKFIYLHDSGFNILKVIEPGLINSIDLINSNNESLSERMCSEGFATQIINESRNRNNDVISPVQPTKFIENKKMSVLPSERNSENDLLIENLGIKKCLIYSNEANSDNNSSFSLLSQLMNKPLKLASYLDSIEIGSQINFIVHEVINDTFGLAILNLEKFIKLSDNLKLEASSAKYDNALPLKNEVLAFLMPDGNWYRGLMLPNNKAFLIDSGNIEQWSKCFLLSLSSRLEMALAALVTGDSVIKYFRRISLPIRITNAQVIESGPSFLKVEAVTGSKRHYLKLFGWEETLKMVRNLVYNTNVDHTKSQIIDKKNHSIDSQENEQNNEKASKNNVPLESNLNSANGYVTNKSNVKQSDDNLKPKNSSLSFDYISSIPKDTLTNGEQIVIPVYQDQNDSAINYVLAKSNIYKTIVLRMSQAANFPIAEPSLGDYVCASSDDDWYRARILSIQQNKCEVYYIDFGNVDFVSKDNIRILPSDISIDKIPAQAIKCRFVNWETVKEVLDDASMIKIKVEGLNDDEYLIKYLSKIE